jgi:hypothetical protein
MNSLNGIPTAACDMLKYTAGIMDETFAKKTINGPIVVHTRSNASLKCISAQGQIFVPIFFGGLRGTDGIALFFSQLIFCLKVIFDFDVKKELEIANKIVENAVLEYKECNGINSEAIVTPLLIGFSLGGFFASAVSIKCSYFSVCFNGLPLNKKTRTYLGESAICNANNENKLDHILVISHGDWVAGDDRRLPGHSECDGTVITTPDYLGYEKKKSLRMQGKIHNFFLEYLHSMFEGVSESDYYASGVVS